MFVRFRENTHRLQVSLIETRRVAGKIRHEHIAGLGAIDIAPSIAARVAFWQQLHERLGKLSNRIDATAQAKVLGEVHARIPMVPIKERRALQLENAEADERFWESLRDMHQANLDDNKGMVEAAGRAVAQAQSGVEAASAKAAAAKDRVARLKRGEEVAGGVDRKLTREDAERAMREAGLSDRDIKKIRIVARLDNAGLEEYVAEVDKLHDRARRGEYRVAREVLMRRLRKSASA